MADKTYRDYQPDQPYLLPPSLDEWLPDDHFAYFIRDVVDELDLSSIYAYYEQEARGYPPYHPKMMLQVLLYAYCQGVRSSRVIARKLEEDVAFRVLGAGNFPDFRTICAFRRRHLDVIEDLFVQVLHIAQDAGMVTLEHVSVDGTKIQANASKSKAMSYGRMDDRMADLEAEIKAILEEAEATDQAEDDKFGPDRRGDELPDKLADPERRLEAIREAKAALEAEAAAEADDGDDPSEPSDSTQYNFTDPESHIMRRSDGGWVQGYNAQVAVDSDSHVIVANAVDAQPNDSPHLKPVIEQVMEHTGRRPQAAAADAGYYSRANVDYLERHRIAPYIPPKKVTHRERRKLKDEDRPRGRIPRDLTDRERMIRKLRTKRGEARYRKREQSVEPVFGHIKEILGFRRFSHRGLKLVNEEFDLICLAHNLKKAFLGHRDAFMRAMARA